MARFSRKGLYSTLVLALLAAISLAFPVIANAQETAANQTARTETASTAAATKATTRDASATPAAAPVFSNYRDISIGMSADEVREKLDHLKEKGKTEDFFVFSDTESAQVYYDGAGKVTAISVNYMGDAVNAPKPEAVLGEAIQAKPDGSIYELRRYPSAGYWIAYSRTAGQNSIITVTMQKM
jgi:zona occludens toxin (predicted ATPase)